jgi:hypothetical protein
MTVKTVAAATMVRNHSGTAPVSGMACKANQRSAMHRA